MAVQFRVLGPLAVDIDGAAVDVRGVRRQALLGTLLMQAPRVVTTHRLLDAIWGESPPASAVANIQTYTSELRRILGRTPTGRPRVEFRANGYAADVAADELDLARFERYGAAGEQALRDGDPESAAELLAAALCLWRERPLDGLVLRSWARARVDALADRKWTLESAWIDARLALGHADALVGRLREMVRERPLSEPARVRLMTALHRAGRNGEALAAYAEARRRLVDELGMEPGEEMRDVQAAILAGHRHRPAATPPRALPPPADALVGRSVERRRLIDALDTSTGVAVYGLPGVGKTALALDVAHAVAHRYPDGQLFASLGDRSDLGPVVAGLLSALGDGDDRPEGRAARLRVRLAERRVLVVLDDVTGAADIRPLLPGGGRSRLLVTGRRHLGPLDRVEAVILGPLDPPGSRRLLAALVGGDRVAAEPEAAARIEAACAGLPLALRIVGARLAIRPQWPLRQMADRLDGGGVDEFRSGELSLRDRLDTSHDMLPEDARRLWAAVATAARPVFTASAAAGGLGWPEPTADRAIEELVAAGLVEPLPAAAGSDPRYRLHPLLGLYGRERAGVR